MAQIPSDPPPRCRRLYGDLENKFAVDISRNYRMVFEEYDSNDNLSVKKNEIVTIQILDITDYH